MIIAQVIPFLRLPRSLVFFDYEVPEFLSVQVKVGQAVRVQFRGRKVMGIISALKSESKFSGKKLQPIIEIASPDPLADEQMIKNLIELASDAFISPALMSRTIFPEIPRRPNLRVEPQTEVRPRQIHSRGFTVPKSFAPKIAAGLSAAQSSAEVFLQIDDSRVLVPILGRLALEAHRLNRHLRILTPNREDVVNLTLILNRYGIPAVRYLPTDGKIKTYELWQKCRANQLTILVGARSAIFFPYPENSTVVVLDEDSDDWKQSDINPRYDARIAIKKLASESHQIFIAPFIRPETNLQIIERILRFEDLRVHESPVTIVNLRDHFKSGNKGTISDTLLEAIRESKKTLLFAHRKGSSGLLICRDCGYRFNCPDCDLPLSPHRNFLRCSACAKRLPMAMTCNSCRGTSLVQYGLGVERVQDEIKKLLPDADITIGTISLLNQYSSSRQDLPDFDLVSIVEADTLLHRPDFRSQEKLGRLVTRLANLARSKPIIIQTAFPELPVWQIAARNDTQFQSNELEERKSLRYPPFSRLAKLIFQNEDQNKALQQATVIANDMKSLSSRAPKESRPRRDPSGLISSRDLSISVEMTNIDIIGPFPSTPPKVRGRYHFNLIIRFSHSIYQELKSYLSTLADDIIIDVDPISII